MRRAILVTALLVLGLSATPAAADPLVMPHVVVAHHTGWAERVIERAGGTVVASYPQVGVVVAYTAKDDFAAKVRRTPGIDAVGATRTAKIPKEFFAPRKDVRYTGPNSPNSGQVPPEGTAWDVPALRLPEAHQVTEGSKRTVVGVLDVGVDDTHPELKDAFDARNSVSCLSGWPDRGPGAWRPTLDGHGTHVAGTIAAARNGAGVVGIAPGTKIAAVKLAELDDTETAESMVCGFVWAAEHGFAVTNNSYRSIPWRYNCDDQPDQAAAKLAVGRAVAYAQRRNVLVVASAGNAGINLDTRSVDRESPADSTPVERSINPTCTRLPHELPGVVGTGALDEKLLKASFSNYSASRISVAAPGARIWSTWPNGEYRSASGTSMAAPHASGVAALIASEHPHWSAERIKRALYASATPLPCPDAVCASTRDGTTYYGHGMVDAASAVGAG
ncbi:S8 family serine peptidase [Amycolatopsis sp. NPDC051045]|uniref:S8 family peptidase n=1 Tax=Amycolatopsis sp. NPDC051045 TaxID=3156922 RepID=UPI0034395099